jgi:hypothetical protein
MAPSDEQNRAQMEQLILDQIASFVGRTMPNYVGDLRPYFQPLAKEIEAAIHSAFAHRFAPATEARETDGLN